MPHGTFTDHWIRVTARAPRAPAARARRVRSARTLLRARPRRPRGGALPGDGRGGVRDARRPTRASCATRRPRSRMRSRTDSVARRRAVPARRRPPAARAQPPRRSVRSSGPSRTDSSRPDALRALAQAYERAGRAPPRSTSSTVARSPSSRRSRGSAPSTRTLPPGGGPARARPCARIAAPWPSSRGSRPPGSTSATVLAEEGRPDGIGRRLPRGRSPRSVAGRGALAAARGAHDGRGGRRARARSRRRCRRSRCATRGPRAPRLVVDGAGAPTRRVREPLRPGPLSGMLLPDGTPLRTLTADARGVARWDLLADGGRPVAGGLYRASVAVPDARGRAGPPRMFYVGIVRR